ncbi:polyprenyl synthetase family protein [Deinococcus sp.]|uniref:polyprenyl synthetase family protein n=1 Tax=Deinococcus sp. TaxID=47478 RepID=UPI003C7D08DE
MRPELLQNVRTLLPEHHPRPEIELLYAMMRDYPFRGGKGVRSELLLLSARAHGVRESTAERRSAGWEAALWLATTLELFQNWVLIHDDIADDSEERRGQPALHRQYGVPLALNAGDALHAYMWGALQKAGLPQAYAEVLTMIHRTAEGQHLDLAWVQQGQWNLSESDYLDMVRLKTAYYTVVTPLRLGAIAAGGQPDGRFEEAGTLLGAAFQIRDDVLNLIGDAALYGKEIGGDLLEGKRTLIALRWLETAPQERRELFLNEMAKNRPDKRPEVIGTLLGWLLESGAVQDAQSVADTLAERGLKLLSHALSAAPDQEAARTILALAEGLARRQK